MTIDELNKIEFKCVCSAAFEYEHTLTYTGLDGRLGFCVHTRKKKDGSFAKGGYTHYQIDGKVYKSRRKFLEALENFNSKIIPMYK